MGQVFSNLIGTCNCSSDKNNKNKYEPKEEINNLKKECGKMKDRLVSLENSSDTKHNLTNQKIENVEIRIANKFNIMNEKFSRLEDKIDTKFDLIILTMNQNNIRSNMNNK